jgi:hypothetical protein
LIAAVLGLGAPSAQGRGALDEAGRLVVLKETHLPELPEMWVSPGTCRACHARWPTRSPPPWRRADGCALSL